MRSALLAFILVACGFTAGDQVIAQHRFNEVCPGGVRTCEKVEGVLSYTVRACYLKLGKVTYTYAVVRWLPKERILQVRGGNFTGFFIIKERYAKFIVTPNDKRYKEQQVTYLIYDTVYYEN